MFFCPFCGARRFTCWPEFWPWQYQGDLFCSENCWICDATKKQMERKGFKMAKRFILTKEQTEEAVKKYYSEGRKAAIAYLEELGSKDPLALWNSLKKRMNVTSEGHQKAKKPTLKLDGQLRIETPEAHNVDIVETPEEPKQVIELHGIDTDIVAMNKQCNFNDRCTVSAIRVKDLGEFYYDKKFTSIDWRTPAGDEVSLGPAWWAQLAEDLPFILQKLGVNM